MLKVDYDISITYADIDCYLRGKRSIVKGLIFEPITKEQFEKYKEEVPELIYGASFIYGKKMNKMISFDTSTTKSAAAIYLNNKYKRYQLFDFSDIRDLDARTEKMCTALFSFLNKEKPQQIYVEMPRGHQNAELVRKLSRIVDSIYTWYILNKTGTSFEEIQPSSWRKLLPGFEQGKKNRQELKDTSIEWVKKNFKIDVPTDDVADAICIGSAMIYRNNIYDGNEDSELFA